MEVEYVYRMHGPASAVACIRQLDTEPAYLLMGLSLALSIRGDGDLDCYVYANFDNPGPADRLRAVQVLKAHGIPTDLSFDQLNETPHLGFMVSGTFNQIAEALRQLASWSTDRVKAGILAALNTPSPH